MIVYMVYGILQLLDKHGCTHITECGCNYVCTCPFHKDTKPSFEIHKDSGLYICFACGASGTYNRFLAQLGEKAEYNEPCIEEIDVTLPDYDRHYRIEPIQHNMQLFGNIPKYLLGRGFSDIILREWGIVFDTASARVVFPVRDRNNNLVGITKRAVDPRQYPKYLHTKFKRGNYLYGMNRISTNRLIVCEGHLDAVAMSQMVGDTCMATMGCYTSNTQIELMRGYSHVTLAGDMDAAGMMWANSVGDRLIPYYDPCAFDIFDNYKGYKDPAEVLEKEKKVIGDVVTYIDWTMKRDKEERS